MYQMLFDWSSILLLYLHSSSFTKTIFVSEVIFPLNEQMVRFQLKCFQESFHVKQKLPGDREAGGQLILEITILASFTIIRGSPYFFTLTVLLCKPFFFQFFF